MSNYFGRAQKFDEQAVNVASPQTSSEGLCLFLIPRNTLADCRLFASIVASIVRLFASL